MQFKFGDIYLAKFDPGIGHEYKGDRPAFIAQEDDAAINAQVITVMPITSRLEKFRPPDVMIQQDQKNRLRSDSVIKVQHIYSFDRSRFILKIGSAGSPNVRAVRGYLRRHFGL